MFPTMPSLPVGQKDYRQKEHRLLKNHLRMHTQFGQSSAKVNNVVTLTLDIKVKCKVHYYHEIFKV